ncbi:MAG: hypothetical protein WD342_19195 [Verrucomicrobiales bacterium]
MAEPGRFCRVAAGIGEAKFLPIGRPNSFFEFLENEFEAVFTGSAGDQHTPLARICSQAREHGASSIVVETLPEIGDLKEENSELKRKNVWNGDHLAKRVSFFRSQINSSRDIDEATENDFIGYFIWKADFGKGSAKRAKRRIYEAVVPPIPAPWRCVRGGKLWECRVANRIFTVRGHLFCQQNEVTNVCAHAAVRTVVSTYHKDGDMSFHEMNGILREISQEEDVDISKGIQIPYLIELLERSGAECSVYECHDLVAPKISVNYQRWTYECIESGFPAILVFGDSFGRSSGEPFLHSVPVFGHTFNPDMWLPRAETTHFRNAHKLDFIPSDYWMGSFIGHDDNFGPNYSIPRHYFRSMRPALNDHPQYPFLEGIACVIGTRPAHVKMRGLYAEIIAMALLQRFEKKPSITATKESPWRGRLFDHIKKNYIVLRTIHLSKADYISHLSKLRGWDDTERFPSELVEQTMAELPPTFWLIELSVPELFSANKRKLGEMLIRSDAPHSDFNDHNLWSSFLGARIPGRWIQINSMPQNSPTPRFSVTDIPIASHSSLYGRDDY